MSLFYKAEQFLPIKIEAAWRFFSSAKNLAVITPPELDFKIRTALDDNEIYEGMLIDYSVKPLLGVPLSWQTKITKVIKPLLFTDIQVKGPYKLWAHTHMFIEQTGGVLMKDEVNYALPFGWLGSLASPFIGKKIERIFDYRRNVLKQLFKEDGSRN